MALKSDQNEPNLYELTGDSVSVTYSTTSFGGQPQFTYKKGRQTLTFTGGDIKSEETDIGTLVTVNIGAIPDKSTTYYSVLVPHIILGDVGKKQSFRALGITTVRATTIAGPPKGAQETYKAEALRGSARQVQFVAGKATGTA